MTTKSPYLRQGRLADVLAALQIMAVGARPEAEIQNWASDLSNTALARDTARWAAVFEEHPEFFLVYTLEGGEIKKAALRWRYTNKLYDHKTGKLYTQEEKDTLPKQQQNLLTTKPLEPDAVVALLNTAIELHSRALAEETARKWWIPILVGATGVIGSWGGAWIALHK